MSATVAAPKRIALSSSTVEVERLQPAARAGTAEPDVDRRRRDVQVLGVGEVGEEAERSSSTCAQTKRRSRTSAARARRRRRCAIAFEIGDQPAGHSLQVDRDQRRVPEEQGRHDQRDQSRGSGPPRRGGCRRSARLLHLADPRSGERRRRGRASRTDRRAARTTPGARATAASRPRSTAPISAITIVGKRTRKPQKMSAWMRPGTSRWNSFR